MPLPKVSNVKTFYDHDDLENKRKVKLITCTKKSCDDASWVQVSSLYLKWILISWAFVYPIFIMRKLNFDPENPQIRRQYFGGPNFRCAL